MPTNSAEILGSFTEIVAITIKTIMPASVPKPPPKPLGNNKGNEFTIFGIDSNFASYNSSKYVLPWL